MNSLDRAQSIVGPPGKAAIFLTVVVLPGQEAAAKDALTDVSSLIRAVRFRDPYQILNCVTGIGASLWDRMFDAPRPAQLHPFEPVVGAKHKAIATAGDLFFHVRAESADIVFELTRQIVARLHGIARVVDEVHAFRYWDSRDLLGFVDGTENPTPASAAVHAAIVDEPDPYAGASYVIVQKYLHDLASWDSLTVEQQELVIGRHKLSDIELPDDVKPADSHVAANTVDYPDGTQRQIFRDNLPFGTIGDEQFGTYFIGYAADVSTTELMLRRMFIGEPAGNYDRILDFSTATTGALFFCPPWEFLDDPDGFLDALGDDPAGAGSASGHDPASAGIDTPANNSDTDQSMPTSGAPVRTDGSLGIGSLRRSDA